VQKKQDIRKFLVRKSQGKRPLARSRSRCKGYIKVVLNKYVHGKWVT